jgi:hypothetical protein
MTTLDRYCRNLLFAASRGGVLPDDDDLSVLPQPVIEFMTDACNRCAALVLDGDIAGARTEERKSIAELGDVLDRERISPTAKVGSARRGSEDDETDPAELAKQVRQW